MSALEFKAARGKLGLKTGRGEPIPQKAYAKLLGVHVSTVQSYERGTTPVPEKIRLKVERLLAKKAHKLRIPRTSWKARPLRKNRRVGIPGDPSIPPRGRPVKKPGKAKKPPKVVRERGYAGEEIEELVGRMRIPLRRRKPRDPTKSRRKRWLAKQQQPEKPEE